MIYSLILCAGIIIGMVLMGVAVAKSMVEIWEKLEDIFERLQKMEKGD